MLQLLLVLFNCLERRHLKQAGKRVSLPPYPGFPEAMNVEKKDNFEIDWKSVVSEEALPGVIKKPAAAIL